MGKNYYHRTNFCADCGRYDELHIGKASKGWRFLFRGYAQEGLKIASWEDWRNRFLEGGQIVSEHGNSFSLVEFERLVGRFKEGKSHFAEHGQQHQPGSCWEDDQGNSFLSEPFE